MVSAREARLGRAVEQLRRRLEQSRAEVAQLEALLRDADAQATGEAVCVRAGPPPGCSQAGSRRCADATAAHCALLPSHASAGNACPALCSPVVPC